MLKPLKKIEAMSDTELANQFARFRPLLNRYRRKYYFVDYDKEDIEQEAWIAFVESYRTYNYELNITFASYYNKVLRNHLNSVLRYQNAYKRTSNIDKVSWDLIEEETSDYDVRFVNQQTPVDEVISKELLKTLLLSLSQLELTVFKELQTGKSIQEIAQMMQLPEKKVKNAYDRMMKKEESIIRINEGKLGECMGLSYGNEYTWTDHFKQRAKERF
ncbi:sigma-70 family RNA polymerase sigma factor [Enterococcus cecorum]|uniref:sigma-70 family RNA polymerase sigma factor n=1 Tax=Enterococcus cecorum TaxID=44008 RepID=UPI0032661B5E